MPINDYMDSTNGPAYEVRETRNGPPLTYVGEKLRRSLEELHDLVQQIDCCVPEDIPLPDDYVEGAPISAKTDLLERPAKAAFYAEAIAFAALFNMLDAIRPQGGVDRLAKMPSHEFHKWLEFIEREGSVTGSSQ